MSERLWLLRGHVHCVEDFLNRLRFGDERKDLDFSTTEGTEQRVNFVDFLDHFCPAQPALAVPVASILLVIVVLVVKSGVWKAQFPPAFCA